MRTPLAALVGVAMLTACSGYQWFRPRTQVTGAAPDGTPAGEYELRIDGRVVGDVRLWSTGARSGAALHVGVELENVSAKPLVLTGVRVESLIAGSAQVASVESEPPAADVVAPPGGSALVELRFPMTTLVAERNRRLEPGEIELFDLVWTVRSGDSGVVSGRTPFKPDVRKRYYYWYKDMLSFRSGC